MPSIDYSRKYEASPWFKATNTAAVAAAGYASVDFEQNNGARKYLPFDVVTIDNASSAAITFYANGNPENAFNIPANSSRTFTRADFPGLTRVVFLNASAVTTIKAGEVVATAQRATYGTDRAVPAAHKFLMRLVGGA